MTVRAVKVDNLLIRVTEALLAARGSLLLFAREPSTLTAPLAAFSVDQTARLLPGDPTELVVLKRR